MVVDVARIRLPRTEVENHPRKRLTAIGEVVRIVGDRFRWVWSRPWEYFDRTRFQEVPLWDLIHHLDDLAERRTGCVVNDLAVCLVHPQNASAVLAVV